MLAHGEPLDVRGGAVVSVPFFGEDPVTWSCRGTVTWSSIAPVITLVLADSGRQRRPVSVKDGVIEDLVPAVRTDRDRFRVSAASARGAGYLLLWRVSLTRRGGWKWAITRI